ncbi:MAG: tetratricopeptide repeat protein [Bacteroidales bacterium]|nr:tetratricopeptide repeat protein [Bacteroidales bacterium]
MLKLNGYLNFLDKDFITAIKSFENCISLNDTSNFTYKYLGYSYFKTEEYQKAKDYLEKAFQKDTSNVELCYLLGLSCNYSVYKELGIQYLSKTIELATPSSEFLSQVYQDFAAANTGFYKYEEALEAYLKAYELNPNDTLLIFKIASHYDNWIKDKDKALIYYQIFMKTRPKEKKPLPKMPVPGGIVVSYYDYVERRMGEIKEELFWQREKHDAPSTKQ